MPKGRGRARKKDNQPHLKMMSDDQSRQPKLPVGLSHSSYAAGELIGQEACGFSDTTSTVSEQFESSHDKPEQSHLNDTRHEKHGASSSKSGFSPFPQSDDRRMCSTKALGIPPSIEIEQLTIGKHGQKNQMSGLSMKVSEQFEDSYEKSGQNDKKRTGHETPPSSYSSPINQSSYEESCKTGSSSISPIRHAQKCEKAQKPGYGTSKRKEIEIVTNFFRINSLNNNIYHYDVEISQLGGSMGERAYPEDRKPINTELGRRIIFELLRLHNHLENHTLVFDGKKNMFAASPLPVEDCREFDIPLSFNNKRKMFCVAIKPVQKAEKKKSINPNDQSISKNIINPCLLGDYRNGEFAFPEEIRFVYDTILSHRAQDSPEVRYGASFFSFIQGPISTIGDGLELRQGYNQNIRFTEIGTAVVINIATSVFHKSGPVIDYAAEILRISINNRTTLSSRNISKLTSALKGVRIQVSHDLYKRKYHIDEVTSILPRNHYFMVKVGNREEEVNVETYFRHQYKLSLKYRDLPLLRMHNGRAYLPFEVCNVVPGQRIPDKNLDTRSKVNMIRSSATPPTEKFLEIQKYAKCASDASSSVMQPYGLSFDKFLKPVDFATRVLKQPEIQYSPSNVIVPNDRGVWELRGTFLSPAETQKWMIISFADPSNCDEKVLDKLAYLLCKAGNKVGLRLQHPVIEMHRAKTSEVLGKAKERGMQFVVIVLSKLDTSHSYHEVKFISDIHYNLVSQCVNEEVITGRKFNDNVASNLCLKINTKLQGINHTLTGWPLALKEEAVLIIGADVVHNVNLVCSSIAAVVGCVDYTISKYAVSCRALSNPQQNGKNQEIILTLAEMVETILLEYYRNTKRKPEKILFYRDGISEGQFHIALEKEIPLIKQACLNVQKDGEFHPPITFVVVQKRIQTRFKPQHPNDGIGKMKNVPAGTIVDRHIVDPVNYDFYLVSHEGIQGTSRPVYYTVLFDENGVKPDVIHQLTYYLCFVYARCNQSISIPAPVKYADLLAYRTLHYVDAYMKQSNGVGRRFFSQDRIPEDLENLIKDVEKIQNRMFFI